jgi:hypothetical protein
MVFSEQLLEDINKYYKLKSEYEKKQQSKIDKIMSNTSLTIADKRGRVKEMINKCVKCKGNGGTIFEETATRLHAVCNAEPKCDLNMEIYKGEPVILLPDLLRALRLKIEKEKVKMIELKMNHAMELMNDDTAVSMFDVYQSLFKRLTVANASLEEKLISITNSATRNDDITRLKIDLYKSVDEYKDNLKEFKGTGREEFMRDALEKYNDEMLPLATELRSKEYNLNELDTIDAVNADNQYRLIQEKYTMKDLEVPFIAELRELLEDSYLNIPKTSDKKEDIVEQ